MWFKDRSLISLAEISNNHMGKFNPTGHKSTQCDLHVSLQNLTQDAGTGEPGRVIFLVPSWRNAFSPLCLFLASHIISKRQLCSFEKGLQVVILADL